MNRQEMQNYQMLARVVDFGKSNPDLFPKNSAGPEIIKAIESSVQQLSEKASAQVSGEAAVRVSKGVRSAARDDLRSRMALLDQTARALGNDKFRTPIKHSDQAMIDSGRAFAADFEPVRKEFVKHGMPSQFADDLNTEGDALARAILDAATAKAMRSGAIREFERIMDDAMANLRRLDAFFANTLGDNPSATASWIAARTVPRVASRKRPVQPPSPPVPPILPAPAPVPVVEPVAA